MTKDQFLREYLDRQERGKVPKPAEFKTPTAKGVTPEVVCPMCAGLGSLPGRPRGDQVIQHTAPNGFKFTTTPNFVTSQAPGPCPLCEGRRVILDRSGQDPKTWRAQS